MPVLGCVAFVVAELLTAQFNVDAYPVESLGLPWPLFPGPDTRWLAVCSSKYSGSSPARMPFFLGSTCPLSHLPRRFVVNRSLAGALFEVKSSSQPPAIMHSVLLLHLH